MNIFKINEYIEVVCTSESTRYGFRHLATLFINNKEAAKAKVCYCNRTWERYEFETVLKKVIDSADLSDEDKTLCMAFINKDHTDYSGFHATAMVAALGEIFGNTQKDANNWKSRMLTAGLALDMPSDWQSLDEDTKQKRLDAAIAVAKNTGGRP